MYRTPFSIRYLLALFACQILLAGAASVQPAVASREHWDEQASKTSYRFEFQCSKATSDVHLPKGARGASFIECSSLIPRKMRKNQTGKRHHTIGGKDEISSQFGTSALIKKVLGPWTNDGVLNHEDCDDTFYIEVDPDNVGYPVDEFIYLGSSPEPEPEGGEGESTRLLNVGIRSTRSFVLDKASLRRPDGQEDHCINVHHDYCRCVEVICVPYHDKCICKMKCDISPSTGSVM